MEMTHPHPPNLSYGGAQLTSQSKGGSLSPWRPWGRTRTGEKGSGVLPLGKFLPGVWALQCTELPAASGPKALAPV